MMSENAAENVNKARFIHLHVHSSQGSMLDSVASVKDLVSTAKKFGMDSLALTDHGTMYGIITFYKECQKQGVKPIIGCEIYVTNDDYSNGEQPDERFVCRNGCGHAVDAANGQQHSHDDGKYFHVSPICCLP